MVALLLLVLLAFFLAIGLSKLLYASTRVYRLARCFRAGYLHLGKQFAAKPEKPSAGTSVLELVLHAVAFWLLWSWPAISLSGPQLAAFFVAFSVFLVIRLRPWEKVAGREAAAIAGLFASTLAAAMLGHLGTGVVSWEWVRLPVMAAAALLLLRIAWDSRFPWKKIYDDATFNRAEVKQVSKKVCVAPNEVPGKICMDALLRSLLLVLVESPVLMLVFPSLAAALAPSAPEWWAAIGLAVTFVFVGSMHVHRELFEDIRFLFERLLTQGLARFVSWGVVLLAGLRLADWPYVTYILDESPGNAIAVSIATAYAVCWLHDHWERRAHAEALVEQIGRADVRRLEVEPHGEGGLLLRYKGVESSLVPWQFSNNLAKVAADQEALKQAGYRLQFRFLLSKLLVVAAAAAVLTNRSRIRSSGAVSRAGIQR